MGPALVCGKQSETIAFCNPIAVFQVGLLLINALCVQRLKKSKKSGRAANRCKLSQIS